MAEYTYKDVIIDPNDPRVEIGKKYYFSDSPINIVAYANDDNRNWLGTLTSVKASGDYRFTVQGEVYACLIRKKEPEKKWVPFDLSKEEDMAKLRGAWVRHKQNPERENLITGLGAEPVDFAVYFGDIAVGTGVLLENFEFVDGTPCGKLVEEE